MWNWKEQSFARFIEDEPGSSDIIYFDETCGYEQIVKAVSLQRPDRMILWGMMEPEGVAELAQREGIDLLRVEDGFLRSAGLTGTRPAPMSLCLDKRGIYFNPNVPSDLEHLLLTYDFDSDSALVDRAKAGITRLRKLGLSKYNHAKPVDLEAVYGPKDRPRVLVLGQVEEDQSIQYGCDGAFDNNALVRAAAEAHPDAQIIYKPHPDVLAGDRDRLSNPDDVRDIALVVDTPMTIDQAFETIDHVHTATSLAGFEALLRGLKVTTHGRPFYAGWGVTEDRLPPLNPRRELTIEQVFAAAYLLYPIYCHPETGARLRFEEALDVLAAERDRMLAQG
ncbi:MAG: capsular polysaccharide biosynthesis protein [Alphaproteobacteria bacterium]|nr:capsular polysaccharide biosynthesis protein [Alphaproteobacteria bacterium SS10]